jgi:quercetin dioxygenase-like cupin family protein
VREWQLLQIDAPAGTRDPVVLHSSEARAVLIALDPGQKLGDHQVHERAWICVVDGTVRVEADGEAVEASPGTLLMFEPSERHALSSEQGARILLFLTPWPGDGHYRSEERAVS